MHYLIKSSTHIHYKCQTFQISDPPKAVIQSSADYTFVFIQDVSYVVVHVVFNDYGI